MDIIQHIATIKNMPLNAPAPAGGLSQYVPYGQTPTVPSAIQSCPSHIPSAPISHASARDGASPWKSMK